MDSSTSHPPGPRRWKRFQQWPVVALTACILALLAGCGPMNQSQLPSGNPGAPAQATVSFCDSAAANCATANTFALQSLRDLNVVVEWQNLQAGSHAQKVNFILPEEIYTRAR